MSVIEAAARELVRQEYYRVGHQPCRQVESWAEQEWPSKVDEVRVVLRAIREANVAMVAAGLATADHRVVDIGDTDLEAIFTAMIEAAMGQ